jgi:PucR C-terminal helix-turn-helix domain
VTTVLDVWRAVDPEARLVSGSADRLARPVRGVARTRAAPPHFPSAADGQLLLADAAILQRTGIDGMLAALHEAELDPAALWVAGETDRALEPGDDPLPVLAGAGSGAVRAESATAYLDGEREWLAAVATDLRLAGAEAALADPQPSAPAGAIAARLRRGVAVTVEGALVSLNPRTAGRALATRFAAAHARLLAERAAPGSAARRTRDGLWILERPVAPRAGAWLFDDLPFAAVDAVALDALAITLRALLRRRAAQPPLGRPEREPRLPPSTGDPLRDTLLAVARANGRIAPAARSLGVHRNTVLYRLHRASMELGIDPRRPEDALRLLREADERRS